MPHFGLNQVLLFLILDVGTQVNKQYFFFSIRNENAPQHTDIVWKGSGITDTYLKMDSSYSFCNKLH